jgi:hypothetical protein
MLHIMGVTWVGTKGEREGGMTLQYFSTQELFFGNELKGGQIRRT